MTEKLYLRTNLCGDIATVRQNSYRSRMRSQAADIEFHYRYRRIRFDRSQTVLHADGTALRRRDDDECMIVDCHWNDWSAAVYTDGSLIEGEMPWGYCRLFLWRTLPVRLFQLFGKSGRCITHRLDFATPIEICDGEIRQIDLFLDMFVDGSGKRCVVRDEDELSEATRLGIVSPDQNQAVLSLCRELVGIVKSGAWPDWVVSQCGTPYAGADVRRSLRFHSLTS